MRLAAGTGAKQSSELRLIGNYFWICWTRPADRPGWQIHAYCLMDNHFHLVVETLRGNLSTGMQWFLGSYTQRFNRCHHLWGHLFGAVTKRFWWTAAQAAHICGESVTMCI